MEESGPASLCLKLLPQTQIVILLPLFYVLTHSWWNSTAIVASLVLILFYFRIAPVAQSAADIVFTPNDPQVIAHKGGYSDAPGNTLAAIRQAKKNGADAVEVDLEFTKDGVPILIHDATVDATTNGTGCVRDMTFQQIRNLDASAKHPRRKEFPGEQIPTLQECIAECLKLDLKLYLDVKGNSDKAVAVIAEEFRQHPQLYKMAAVCSFFPTVIYGLRKADPKIVTALLARWWYLSFEEDGNPKEMKWWLRPFALVSDLLFQWMHSWLWFLCGNSAFMPNHNEMSFHQVRYWKERGIQVVTWTVNDFNEKQYLAKTLKISYITDKVKLQ